MTAAVNKAIEATTPNKVSKADKVVKVVKVDKVVNLERAVVIRGARDSRVLAISRVSKATCLIGIGKVSKDSREIWTATVSKASRKKRHQSGMLPLTMMTRTWTKTRTEVQAWTGIPIVV